MSSLLFHQKTKKCVQNTFKQGINHMRYSEAMAKPAAKKVTSNLFS